MAELAALNPYAAPVANLVDETDPVAQAEKVRRSMLRHAVVVFLNVLLSRRPD